MKLEEISRGFILRAAISQMSRLDRRRHCLWVLVRNLCGVGSGSAHAICQELGWDPDAAGTAALPPEKNPVQEKWTKKIPTRPGIYDFRSVETEGTESLIKIFNPGGTPFTLLVEEPDTGTNPLDHFHHNLMEPEYRFHSHL